MMLQVVVESVRASLMSAQRVVVLKAVDEERHLPIWIGPFEADAIAMQLQGLQVPRPMSHDLLKQVVLALGGKVARVVIHDLRNDTFFARLVLQYRGGEVPLDARPSDCIALAVRVEAPIFVESAVLDRAGITPATDLRQQRSDEPDEEDLSVFREFIEELALDTPEDQIDEEEE